MLGARQRFLLDLHPTYLRLIGWPSSTGNAVLTSRVLQRGAKCNSSVFMPPDSNASTLPKHNNSSSLDRPLSRGCFPRYNLLQCCPLVLYGLGHKQDM